ncbi:3-hydroxyacyl-CoA dehydrogenase family protein [Blastococcus sp. CT_GayMR19]|uniref:3-hydroxyacyl-CoA dehydrogenase family protein n=1 Tax=Blastococcus sp. CT_GayMR19 TaxID=2559608 RepID=UPI001073ED08|nr:3-hydroxyacyl-CoA dehydrogenase family protein [Blastococcus sp. CT_GayMR19]TFV77446.1 3-hydroxyacyl-CoA dehydrogenase family protein [Blastococcus sp. CT_GayMR19]
MSASEDTGATVAVLGGGQMGSGIAHAFLTTGCAVTVVEALAPDTTRERITASVEGAAARGKLTEAVAEVLARLSVRAGPAEIPADAVLVAEAVPEDAALKARLLREAEHAVHRTAVLATNTSSLSVSELAATLDRPDRFLGMHFFNPVPASRLVEIVVGGDTAPDVVEAAGAWVRRLGKTGIVVRDSPGFASSRLGVLLGLEAIRMLEDGVADAEAIDTAMELGYRHPMGPLRSTDLVGLDVRLSIAEYLHRTLGDRFAPPQLLRDKVAAGELGRKTGRGFYDYG